MRYPGDPTRSDHFVWQEGSRATVIFCLPLASYGMFLIFLLNVCYGFLFGFDSCLWWQPQRCYIYLPAFFVPLMRKELTDASLLLCGLRTTGPHLRLPLPFSHWQGGFPTSLCTSAAASQQVKTPLAAWNTGKINDGMINKV